MENWQDLYKELAEKITNKMPQISWVDLWHNQVSFLADEHRFNTPAVFIALRSGRIEDIGERGFARCPARGLLAQNRPFLG
ncbi:hypothetical protein EQP59_04460 [Ornithobacterium rhinotracheale]|uniref:Uncharacterized protein n=1 Tax=Ornithobacterium rhinotracheale TaxID=28251 RepID=A0A3R5Y376_ORNRH|nr:hypothetical protein [Ornithobacterium rhinotracheale]QAR30650.1 hypothetical protein EQP59_04460 [Ornithobacterium rhinotracheale]